MNNKIVGLVIVAAAILANAGWILPGQHALQEQVQSLQAQTAALTQQAQASNDYVSIANLQASYGFYVDKSHWDDAADLFTTDATLEIAGRGVFKSQDRIREYLHSLGELEYGRLYNHMQLQPVIHVESDNRSAKARWRSFIQVGHLGKDARWGEATYENEYAKQDGVWRISKLHSFITFYVDFDQGWNKGAVGMPQKKENLEPDAETTVKYAAFPDVFVPPYHYKNPVTGK